MSVRRLCAAAPTAAVLGIVAAGALAVRAADEKSGAAACFARLKELKGDWMGKDPSGKEQVVLRFRVTSGGNAVEEIELPGSDHEMITVYCMDGENLVLTHYCHLGNQPHMKATAASTPSQIVFECMGGGNLKSHDDAHMHALKLTLPDASHLEAEWTLAQNGKPGFVAKFAAQRK